MIVVMSAFTEVSSVNLGWTTAADARSFLLSDGYFNDKKLLPEIINPQHLSHTSLDPIDWTIQKPAIPRTHLIKLISTKGDKGQRVHGLIHPKLYLHLVDEITSEPLWGVIRSKLTQGTSVDVYTLPQFTNDALEYQKAAWKHFDKIDYFSSSIGYDSLLQVDIQNFYGSIYTHAISWALLGKEQAKNQRGLQISANRLDKLMQNANDGQTNGIPVGNEISNIIAELILKDIDRMISPVVARTKSTAMRFRDDYKFLCKTTGDANHIYVALIEALNEYGLAVNPLKTKSGQIFGQNNSVKTKLISEAAFNQHWPYNNDDSEGGSISSERLYYAISCIVDMSKFGTDRKLLNFYLSRIIRYLSRDDVSLTESSLWAEPISGLLIGLYDNAPVHVSYVFALIDIVLHAYKQENSDASIAIVISIVNRYEKNRNTLLNIWIYLLCLKADSIFAEEFLIRQDSEIFNMIKSPHEDDIISYTTRDPIRDEDIQVLRSFSLIDRRALDRIETSSNPIAADLYESISEGQWLGSFYE
jgi:hypothetical protein